MLPIMLGWHAIPFWNPHCMPRKHVKWDVPLRKPFASNTQMSVCLSHQKLSNSCWPTLSGHCLTPSDLEGPGGTWTDPPVRRLCHTLYFTMSHLVPNPVTSCTQPCPVATQVLKYWWGSRGVLFFRVDFYCIFVRFEEMNPISKLKILGRLEPHGPHC